MWYNVSLIMKNKMNQDSMNEHKNSSTDSTYQVTKLDTGFNICFSVQNANLDLVSIFGFPILDILHLVNKDDLIDLYRREMCVDGMSANVQMVFKHLFKDIGLPQFYMNMFFQCVKTESEIVYNCVPDKLLPALKKDGYNISSHNMHIPIESIKITCVFPTNQTAICEVSIKLDTTYSKLSQYESMLLSIFKKMFNKVKRFIETSV